MAILETMKASSDLIGAQRYLNASMRARYNCIISGQFRDGFPQGLFGLGVGQRDPEPIADVGTSAIGMVLFISIRLRTQVEFDQASHHLGLQLFHAAYDLDGNALRVQGLSHLFCDRKVAMPQHGQEGLLILGFKMKLEFNQDLAQPLPLAETFK